VHRWLLRFRRRSVRARWLVTAGGPGTEKSVELCSVSGCCIIYATVLVYWCLSVSVGGSGISVGLPPLPPHYIPAAGRFCLAGQSPPRANGLTFLEKPPSHLAGSSWGRRHTECLHIHEGCGNKVAKKRGAGIKSRRAKGKAKKEMSSHVLPNKNCGSSSLAALSPLVTLVIPRWCSHSGEFSSFFVLSPLFVLHFFFHFLVASIRVHICQLRCSNLLFKYARLIEFNCVCAK